MPFDGQDFEATPETKILDKMIGYLRQGWCKHELEDRHGNVCLYGAFARATTGSTKSIFQSNDWQRSPVMKAMEKAIRATGYEGYPAYPIAGFNNEPATTLADVIAVCERAKKILMEEAHAV